MLKIDSHQHFWKFDPIRDQWMTPDMAQIQKDFLPRELRDIFSQHHIQACISVQSCSSESDNDFLLDLAKNFPFIKGIVGWIDFMEDNLESRLEEYQKISLLKGFRYNLQAEPEELMLNPKFKRGISLLNPLGFTYDLILKPHQLKTAKLLVKSFPYQAFILDHMAKPPIKRKELGAWEKDIREMAKNQNLYCKVSGLGTEADWNHWKLNDIKPYLDIVFEAFGMNRLLYGSDWPVCNLAGGYDRALESLQEYLEKLSHREQAKIWGENAVEFYHLEEFRN